MWTQITPMYIFVPFLITKEFSSLDMHIIICTGKRPQLLLSIRKAINNYQPVSLTSVIYKMLKDRLRYTYILQVVHLSYYFSLKETLKYI